MKTRAVSHHQLRREKLRTGRVKNVFSATDMRVSSSLLMTRSL